MQSVGLKRRKKKPLTDPQDKISNSQKCQMEGANKFSPQLPYCSLNVSIEERVSQMIAFVGQLKIATDRKLKLLFNGKEEFL